MEAFDDPVRFYKENWEDFPTLDPHPLFDQVYYLSQMSEAPEMSPLEHYLAPSKETKPDPNIFFDQSYYEETQMVAASEREQLSALEHFTTFFYSEYSTEPSPAFDSEHFKRHNTDLVNSTLNPVELLRFDPESGLRIYGKAITKKLIKAFALDQGPRKGQYRSKRYILVLPGEVQDSESLEQVLHFLEGVKADKRSEIIAICATSHRQQVEQRLGKSAVSGIEDMMDSHGALSEAALALNLKCMVSPFKASVIISESSLDKRILFGGENLTFDEVGQDQLNSEESAPEEADLPKVIIPINSWQISGVNTWVTNISEGLRTMGFEVELLCTRDFYRFTTSMALPSGRLKLLQAPLSKTPMWWAVVSDYIHSQENAVILCAFDFRFNAIAAVLPKRIPMIGVIHSDDRVYYRACEHLGGYWQHIITVSDHIRLELQEKHPQWAGKITKVNYGIKSWDGDLPAPPKPGEPIRIIYTGRIVHEQKRLLDLPQLLQELDAREVKFQLDLVGNGKDEEELRSLLEKWIDRGNVIMHGRRGSGEIDYLLSRSHVFLLISDYEGLPLSLLEAMAHGVVPVVSDIDSGIPEVIHHGETGYRIPIGDYTGFAETIARLGESTEEWKSVSKSTREFFMENLTREVMSRKTAKLIRKVADPENRESFQPSPLSPESVSNNSGNFGDIALNITQP